jgi:hypothetical protein
MGKVYMSTIITSIIVTQGRSDCKYIVANLAISVLPQNSFTIEDCYVRTADLIVRLLSTA